MVLGSVIYHNSVYPLVSLVLALALAVELVFFLTLEVIMRRNYSKMIHTLCNISSNLFMKFLHLLLWFRVTLIHTNTIA